MGSGRTWPDADFRKISPFLKNKLEDLRVETEIRWKVFSVIQVRDEKVLY